MAHKTIVTDLNRCVGCLGCIVACKTVNDVRVGSFRNKVLRQGPFPREEGGNWPDVDMYFLPVSCQHCASPECVTVCPTGASRINEEDGTVQIDRDQCIGCGACLTACPYGCRYVDVDTSVAEKCDLCASITSEGGLPQCVTQCGGMARWYGDLDEGIESFKGPRGETLGDFVEAYTDDDLHRLDDEGNDPQGVYILRHMAWQGGDVSMQ